MATVQVGGDDGRIQYYLLFAVLSFGPPLLPLFLLGGISRRRSRRVSASFCLSLVS